MDLYLLRHGKSDHDSSKWRTDAERPLSKKGISTQNHCSVGMKNLGIKIEKVWVSPYRRARQTFEIVQNILKLKCEVEFKRELTVFENPKEILHLLKSEYELNSGISLLLVGHNPHLSELLAILVGNENIDMKTSELAFIEFSGVGISKLMKYYTRDALLKLS
ncbi:MAG: Phosphohistidine phosphatase SixA [Candidatus Heimdallarchaeota archaeon LC_3]|nr:MAG: Phosphohistidine phosphatase SixA [Candidatus Heimdallarchaeota archaeon LC_3]